MNQIHKASANVTRGCVTLCLLLVAQLAAGQDPVVSQDHARSLSRAFRHAAEVAKPAVVTVIGRARLEDDYGPRRVLVQPDGSVIEIEPQGSAGSGELEDVSLGSGVIIHETGMVLTNSHVIAEADEVVVRLEDGREFATTDIKRDELSDVAMLRIVDPPSISPARLGNSDGLEIGDWVLAIGSPFELETTVSAGIISGKGRGINKIRRGKLLQTDAAINPGNSGGPLVNLDGEVIGLNTAIASSSGGYQGIGFAIPINYVKWIIGELAEYGEVRRSYLGVEIRDLDARESIRRGLQGQRGVLISGIRPGSPADKAGLQEEDVIVEFSGERVRDSRDLQGVVEQKSAGAKYPLVFLRKGQRLSAQIEPTREEPTRNDTRRRFERAR
ncbi:MAG: trypsin-like peptidase domain-containing protein [Planctomycetales bacterium]|nr:trypsin-like peptidase domain-containing protein [Planctomycetales bacterium]